MSYLRNYTLRSRAQNPDCFDRNGIYREPRHLPRAAKTANEMDSVQEAVERARKGVESCNTQLGRQQKAPAMTEKQIKNREIAAQEYYYDENSASDEASDDEDGEFYKK